MPRPSRLPSSALGVAIRAQRGERTVTAISADLGITHATLSRLEHGNGAPSASTAVALSKWLNWSVEQVLDAAKTAAPEEKETGA